MDTYEVEAYVKLLRGETREGTISIERLVRLGYQRGAQPALICLSDQKMEARVAAARVLGLMGDARAVEPLLGCLKDQSPGVREAAATALGQLRDPRATLPLVGCLEDQSLRVRAAVFMALAKLRDPRATLPLVACLKDQPSKMRQVAIVALGGSGMTRRLRRSRPFWQIPTGWCVLLPKWRSGAWGIGRWPADRCSGTPMSWSSCQDLSPKGGLLTQDDEQLGRREDHETD